jgi:hypothetical protein
MRATRRSALIHINPPEPAPQDNPAVFAQTKPSPAVPQGRVFATAHRRVALPFESPTAKLHGHGAAPVGRALNRDDELPHGTRRFDRIIEIFEAMQNGVVALTERMAAEVPSFELEWAYTASGTFMSSLDVSPTNGAAIQGSYPTLRPTTSETVLISSVSAFIPAGTSAVLTLGTLVVPVGSPSASNWTGAAPALTLTEQKIILFSSDVRQLALASGSSAGPMALVLSGQVHPTRGRMPL